jgi:hypothetical protein
MLYLEAEVILANVLSKAYEDCGVGIGELNEYCSMVKQEIAKQLGKTLSREDYEHIYFELHRDDLKNAIKTFENLFVQMGDKYYQYRRPNPQYFNSRFTKGVAKILEGSAVEFNKKLTERNLNSAKAGAIIPAI